MKKGKNPRDIKFILAEELVDRFHKKGEGKKSKEIFLNRFQKGNIPDEIESKTIDIDEDSIGNEQFSENGILAHIKNIGEKLALSKKA